MFVVSNSVAPFGVIVSHVQLSSVLTLVVECLGVSLTLSVVVTIWLLLLHGSHILEESVWLHHHHVLLAHHGLLVALPVIGIVLYHGRVVVPLMQLRVQLILEGVGHCGVAVLIQLLLHCWIVLVGLEKY